MGFWDSTPPMPIISPTLFSFSMGLPLVYNLAFYVVARFPRVKQRLLLA
jgi:hypothetical protein